MDINSTMKYVNDFEVGLTWICTNVVIIFLPINKSCRICSSTFIYTEKIL